MAKINKSRAVAIRGILGKPKYIDQVARSLNMSRETASRYLKYLYRKGKLRRKRMGKRVYYWRR